MKVPPQNIVLKQHSVFVGTALVGTLENNTGGFRFSSPDGIVLGYILMSGKRDRAYQVGARTFPTITAAIAHCLRMREEGLGSEKVSKYRNKKTEVDGITFDSKREANRYFLLKAKQEAGEIRNLRLQVPFDLVVEREKVCRYVADFVYEVTEDGRDRCVVEDAKGVRTATYKLKKKLLKACLGIDIVEV